ncbi:hypothetical protein BMS3Bbin10_02646 [bacterium BMS3Bbin10]|nr:hypothetical protein BMS3Bbin10_02646 [bacterium BMS3Bbin10]
MKTSTFALATLSLALLYAQPTYAEPVSPDIFMESHCPDGTVWNPDENKCKPVPRGSN